MQYCFCFNQFEEDEIHFGSFYNTYSITFVKQLPLSVPSIAAFSGNQKARRACTCIIDQRCILKQTRDLSRDYMSLLPSQWNSTEMQVTAKPGSYLCKLLQEMLLALLPEKHHLKYNLSKTDSCKNIFPDISFNKEEIIVLLGLSNQNLIVLAI